MGYFKDNAFEKFKNVLEHELLTNNEIIKISKITHRKASVEVCKEYIRVFPEAMVATIVLSNGDLEKKVEYAPFPFELITFEKEEFDLKWDKVLGVYDIVKKEEEDEYI